MEWLLKISTSVKGTVTRRIHEPKFKRILISHSATPTFMF